MEVLVYQMGRVGSVAVSKALKTAGIKRTIHVHYMYPGGEYAATSRTKLLLERIQTSDNKWNVVSLVRDPIKRNLSEYTRKLGGPVLPSKAAFTHNFLHFYNHIWPLVWFDLELNRTFNINVYAMPFDKAKGYTVYALPNVNLLIVHTEKLDHVAGRAFKEWLGLENFSVPHKNETIEPRKSYYEYAKEKLLFSPGFLDYVYNSKYVQHFFTGGQIRAFREGWHTHS